MNIKFKGTPPVRMTKNSIGYDIVYGYSTYTVIEAKSFGKIPTGCFITKCSKNYYFNVRGRSSAFLEGIFVHPGLIDPDFRGEIQLLCYNSTDDDFIVSEGQRIAQLEVLVLPKVELEGVAEFDEERIGGFGSTGA